MLLICKCYFGILSGLPVASQSWLLAWFGCIFFCLFSSMIIFCLRPCLALFPETVGHACALQTSDWSTLDAHLPEVFCFDTSFWRLLVILGYCGYLLWPAVLFEVVWLLRFVGVLSDILLCWWLLLPVVWVWFVSSRCLAFIYAASALAFEVCWADYGRSPAEGIFVLFSDWLFDNYFYLFCCIWIFKFYYRR